jgi:hypothetical protein
LISSISEITPRARRAISRPVSVLQFLDLRGQRGLAHEARFGGAAEVAVFGQGNEIMQIAEVHGRR